MIEILFSLGCSSSSEQKKRERRGFLLLFKFLEFYCFRQVECAAFGQESLESLDF